MGIHETQRSPIDSAAEALDFMQHIHPKVSEHNLNPKFIINMDQSPIFFPYYSMKTLEWKGTKLVNICSSKNDPKRVTLAVSVCTDDTSCLQCILKETQNCFISKKSSQIFHMAVSITSRKIHKWMRVQ